MVLRLRGMISVFEHTDATNAMNRMLMSGRAPVITPEVLTELARAHGTLGAAADAEAWCERPASDCPLTPAQMANCRAFMDAAWAQWVARQGAAAPRQHDIKIVLPAHAVDILAAIVSGGAERMSAAHVKAARAAGALYALHPDERHWHSNDINAPKVVLRLTRGPTPGYIKWHVDAGDGYHRHKLCTTQVALNPSTEYEGGRLLFFRPERPLPSLRIAEPVVIERPEAGHMTHHRPRAMHAVQRLLSGSRYALFILDNYAGLGDDRVMKLSNVGAVMRVWKGAEEAGGPRRPGRASAVGPAAAVAVKREPPASPEPPVKREKRRRG